MIFFLEPLFQVFLPSALTVILGLILDFTMSESTLKYYWKEKSDLYISGIKSSLVNLLVISPLNYIFAYNFIFSSNMFTPQVNFIKLILMLLTHNLLYYVLHMSVHKYPKLRFIHDFHHKFTINLPSIGNAVSIYEFQFMYVIPFLVGLFFFQPNIVTFNMSIYIISLLNLLIHCDQLKELDWIQGLVSPNKHCQHHKNYFGNYSAPLLDLDYIFKKE